jgi:hypothetical protein
MAWLLNKKNVWVYLLVATGLVMLVGEIINERFYMHDFEVYYKTANRFLKGDALYRTKDDGHFIFKYSPTSAFYFIPLALLPYQVASVLFWLILTLVLTYILAAFYSVTNFAVGNPASVRQKNTVLILTFLVAVTHFHRELHLGQVNLLLLALYVFTLQNLISKKYLIAGFVLAASLFIKPFGLIFIPYFLVKGQFKVLLSTVLSILLLGLLPFIFYPDLTSFKELYTNWFTELAIELRAKQSLLQAGNHTIFSVLARYTPVQYLVTSAAAAKVYQLFILALVGLTYLYFMRKGRQLKNPMVAEVAILICLIPLFAVTSMNAFLFAVPCILYLLYYYPKMSGLGKVTLIVACLLLGGNNHDLMGRRLFRLLEDNSVYTFGALLALGLMFYVRLKVTNAFTTAGENNFAIEKEAKVLT